MLFSAPMLPARPRVLISAFSVLIILMFSNCGIMGGGAWNVGRASANPLLEFQNIGGQISDRLHRGV
jgi:hypothetical protein